MRQGMGFPDPNLSPIGQLANTYRRTDPGTKNLFIERSLAKEFYERFRKGDPEFLMDDKWWEAAQEADKLRATGGAAVAPDVDGGGIASDNIGDYFPISSNPSGPDVSPSRPISTTPTLSAVPQSSKLDDLMMLSTQMISWSGAYSYANVPALNVKVWELNSGQILLKGESVPCIFFADGVDCDFVYNPRHLFLSQFPVSPRELLSLYLSEKFKARDSLPDIGKVYSDIVQSKLQDVRIDRTGLQEKAAGMFDRLREALIARLVDKSVEVLECIHESSGESEETINSLLSDPELMCSFQDKKPEGLKALRHVPHRTLLRIVDKFPEELFDGNVFTAPFLKINLSDPQATQRSRNESKERVLTFMKDALWVLNPSSGNITGGRAKDELARCSHSINFLYQEIVD